MLDKIYNIYDFVKVTGFIPISLVLRSKFIYKNKECKKEFKKDPIMIAANHRGFLDPFLIVSTFYFKRVGIIATKELFNTKFKKALFTGFRAIYIDKDNVSIKEDGETKGTKADYIFKVFCDEEKSMELASVACEMKSEDPNSTNKRKNSDHYKKLDADRKKKNCEYALLVSELEWNDDNDVPIRKVKDYDKMYVVRPQYFITFLNIIASLANKYQSVLLEKKKEKIAVMWHMLLLLHGMKHIKD